MGCDSYRILADITCILSIIMIQNIVHLLSLIHLITAHMLTFIVYLSIIIIIYMTLGYRRNVSIHTQDFIISVTHTNVNFIGIIFILVLWPQAGKMHTYYSRVLVIVSSYAKLYSYAS